MTEGFSTAHGTAQDALDDREGGDRTAATSGPYGPDEDERRAGAKSATDDDYGAFECHACGESIGSRLRVCPRCTATALGEVVVLGDVPPRAVYAVAKALGEAHGLPFRQVTVALERAIPIMSDLTRAEAVSVALLLSRAGLHAHFRTATDAASRPGAVRARPRARGVALLVASLLGLTLLTCLAVGVLRGRPTPRAGAAPDAGPSGPVILEDVEPDPRHLSAPEIATLALPATVTVRCADAVGSGFYVTPELVLTSRTVKCLGPLEVVLADGTRLDGVLQPLARAVDAALILTARVDLMPLRLADASRVRVGQEVYATGSPTGLASTLTRGRVAHVAREEDGLFYMQLDLAVNAGSSGGPLLDERGGVIGIVSGYRVGSDGVGFALPVNYLFPQPFGPLPNRWDAAAWSARVGRTLDPNAEERTEEAPIDAIWSRAVRRGTPVLLAGGRRVHVMPPGWQRGFPSDPSLHALVGSVGGRPPSGPLVFEVLRAGTVVCSISAAPTWRPTAGLQYDYVPPRGLQGDLDSPPQELGLVRLVSTPACEAWGTGASLRLAGTTREVAVSW